MIKLISIRLSMLLPTVLLILVCAYMLSTNAPGDEVAIRLDLVGESSSQGIEEYERAYRSLERDLGLTGPLFYISMVPQYHSDEIFNIVPLSDRKVARDLNKKIKNWDRVYDFYSQVKGLLIQLEGEPKYRNTRLQVSNLLKSSEISSIQPVFIHPMDTSKIASSLHELNSTINSLAFNDSFIYPTLRWNGTQNQFHHWIARMWNGNNVSLRDGVSVRQKILSSIAWTVSLSLLTLLLACGLSVVIAIWIHAHQDDRISKGLNGLLYLLYAIPLFWLATMAVVFLTTDDYGSWTHIFPAIGIRYWELNNGFWADITVYARQLILPILCMVLVSLSYLSRQLAMDLKQQDSRLYSTIARAKGVDKKQLIWHHQLPNALMPFITIITGALPRTIVGSAIIETIFNIPGVGKLLLDSIYFGDWPVIFSIIIIVGIVTIVSYALSDILYAIFYPNTSQNLLS